MRENPIQLQLNDFIPRVPDEARGHVTSIADDLVTVQAFDPKAARFYANDGKSWGKFHRQVSKEEQMYNRDMATYMKTVRTRLVSPVHHFPSLLFSKRTSDQRLKRNLLIN